MGDIDFEKRIKIVGELVRNVESTLTFTMLEIGALPVEGQKEPFYQLLDIFPESRIIAFEVDKKLCEQLLMGALNRLQSYMHCRTKFRLLFQCVVDQLNVIY